MTEMDPEAVEFDRKFTALVSHTPELIDPIDTFDQSKKAFEEACELFAAKPTQDNFNNLGLIASVLSRTYGNAVVHLYDVADDGQQALSLIHAHTIGAITGTGDSYTAAGHSILTMEEIRAIDPPTDLEMAILQFALQSPSEELSQELMDQLMVTAMEADQDSDFTDIVTDAFGSAMGLGINAFLWKISESLPEEESPDPSS